MKASAPIRMVPWRKVAAIVCLLMLAVLTTANAAHVHHGADNHCQLCQLSHSPASGPLTAAVTVYVATPVADIWTEPRAPYSHAAVRNFTIRPPPASSLSLDS
jgi:hypothetical protein